MTAGTTMAKKKPSRKAVEFRTVGMRATVGWAEWLERAAKFCRTDVAKLIDASVADYVKERGFSEAPPERIP